MLDSVCMHVMKQKNMGVHRVSFKIATLTGILDASLFCRCDNEDLDYAITWSNAIVTNVKYQHELLSYHHVEMDVQ